MEGKEIVVWFSIIVFVLVAIWAIAMINSYNKIDKN